MNHYMNDFYLQANSTRQIHYMYIRTRQSEDQQNQAQATGKH